MTTAEAIDAMPRPAIDVSGLPTNAFDWRSPLWWGNTLMIFIETTTMALMFATYFYVRRNFPVFPPPRVNVFPPLLDTAPRLGIPSLNLALIVLSCVPMVLLDRAARKMQQTKVRVLLAVMFLLGCAATWLRFHEFPALLFRWDANAYASSIWTILGLHLTYILAGTLEMFILAAWAWTHKLDSKHALDVTIMGVYWYWMAAIWVLAFAVVFLSPRWL